MLWGHRHPFDGGFHAMGGTLFPGMEPIGDYPIHIILKNGKITLLGVGSAACVKGRCGVS